MVEETGAYSSSAPGGLTELEGRGTGSHMASTGDFEHSVATAGICVANTNNSTLLAGIDWNAKFYSSPHSASSEYFAEAIWACVENGCKIINNSWSAEGGTDGSYSTLLSVRNAYLCGVLVVAAMGNNRGDQDRFPACYSDLALSVASSDRNNAWSNRFSNYNNYVDLTAPGGTGDGNQSHDIFVLKTNGGTQWFYGTSFSAPMVSGVASLMMSMRDDVRAEDVEAILIATANDISPSGWDKYTGYGKINAGEAVKMLSAAYTIERNTTSGGTSTQLDNDWVTWSFLPSFALYGVKRYSIEKNISFQDGYVQPPLVWGNISGTLGVSVSNPHYEIPWCGPKNGSITHTGVTLQTYVFRVFNPYTSEQFWYPCAPSEVEFAYTVLGKNPTTAGELIENETWINRTINITDNITIPIGVTLKTCYGSVINLNGYSIISTGGFIIVESGTSLNPDIRLMNGTTIKGLYPSIASALSNASTGDRIYINNMTTSFSSSYSIPAGITYEFNNSNLSFGSNVQLRVLGGLKSNNTTFTRSGGSNWWGIRFYDSAIDGNCLIENSVISYANYGLYAYYSNPTIRNNNISNGNYGVYLNNSGSAVVSTNAITACTRGIYGYYAGLSDFTDNYITSGGASRVAGIQVYNATEPNIYNNTIEGSFTYGLDADHYSRPLAIGPSSQDYQGYNRIIGGQTATVYTHDHSESVLGTCFSSDGYAGYNTIYLDIGTDKFAHIRAENYSNILAQKNYWGDYPPSDFSADGTSSIDYSYALSSDPGGGSSLAKTLGGLLADVLNINILPFDDAESVETLWRETTELWQSLQYRKALENCNTLLQNYPDSPYASLAFLRSVYAKRALKSTDMAEYLQKYVDTQNLRTMALELLIGEDLSNQRFKAGVEKSKTVIKENPDTEAEYKAMFGLFNLYSTDLEDKESAQTVLNAMKGKYADYGLTQMAQFEIGETVDWQLAKPIAFQKEPEPEVVSILPDKFELKPNYPNPFNPTTNIAFALPEASNVQISIYDLTGREIWRSVKTNYEAGNHTLTWNGVNQSGANVVSGIYLVRMVSPKLTATQRIVLMK